MYEDRSVIPRKKHFSVPQENLLPSVRGILLTRHLYNTSQIEREWFEFNLGHFISYLFLKVQLLCLSFACALSYWSTLFSILDTESQFSKNQKSPLTENKRKLSSICCQVKGVGQGDAHSPFRFCAAYETWELNCSLCRWPKTLQNTHNNITKAISPWYIPARIYPIKGPWYC